MLAAKKEEYKISLAVFVFAIHSITESIAMEEKYRPGNRITLTEDH